MFTVVVRCYLLPNIYDRCSTNSKFFTFTMHKYAAELLNRGANFDIHICMVYRVSIDMPDEMFMNEKFAILCGEGFFGLS